MPKINVLKISTDKETRKEYRKILMTELKSTHQTSRTPQDRWNEVQAIMKESGMASAGKCEKPRQHK